MINRKTKKIILLEFKRTSDYGESYFKDMWRVAEKKHTPIMTGLKALAEDREWVVTVIPLVAASGRSGKRSGWKLSGSSGSGRKMVKGSYRD